MDERQRQAILAAWYGMRERYETLAREVRRLLDPDIDPSVPAEAIYTITHRLKDEQRLCEKLEAEAQQEAVTADNFASLVKDLLGIRIVCPRLSDVERVEHFLQSLIDEKRLRLLEGPDRKQTFVLQVDPRDDLPDDIELQYSGYSSIHYVLALGESLGPSETLAGLRAELQVRTLLEEAWGELDHKYRYELVRAGAELPDLVERGFYSFAAYLQAAALQAEYLCIEVDRLRPKPADVEADAVKPAEQESPAEQLRRLVTETVGFAPTQRTLNYVSRRLGEEGMADDFELLRSEIITRDALKQFRDLYREVAGDDPFTNEEERDVDLINALNYALFSRRRGKEVGEAGARDVLVRRFVTNPPMVMLPAEMLATRIEELASERRGTARGNTAALDSLATYLVSLGMVGTDPRSLKIDLLIPVFRDRRFPSDATRELLLSYEAEDPSAHEELLKRIVELETGRKPCE